MDQLTAVYAFSSSILRVFLSGSAINLYNLSDVIEMIFSPKPKDVRWKFLFIKYLRLH